MEKNIKIGDRTYCIASDDNYLDAVGEDFEPHMVNLYRALIGPDDVVADIGANIGLTAILFSSLAQKVFAFEPSPSTYKILTSNLARAGVTNVETANLGLGQEIESLTITFAANNRSGGFISDKIRPETGHITEAIRMDTLDNFFAHSESMPSFLKIDVEGFEPFVIKGGGSFMRKNEPVVVMEMNHFCLNVLRRITIPDFLDFMRSIFPYLFAVDTDNTTIVDLHDPDRAYFVMHEHVVRHRFPNVAGGYEESIKAKLDKLAVTSSIESCPHRHFPAKLISKTLKKLTQSKPFQTPPVAKPNGSIQVGSIPASVAANDIFEIPITLTNSGMESWHGYGTHPVLLCYHWQNADGSYQVYDGMRTELKTQIVHPGKSRQEIVRVVAPSEKGSFKLTLTVVQEGVCWFEDKDFRNANVMVEVV